MRRRCSPFPGGGLCGLVVCLLGAAPQPRAGPALLPVGAGQGDRDPGVAPRACGAAPSASTGGLVGVSGAARDAAALAPAHGGPSLDVPVDSQGTASGL